MWGSLSQPLIGCMPLELRVWVWAKSKCAPPMLHWQSSWVCKGMDGSSPSVWHTGADFMELLEPGRLLWPHTGQACCCGLHLVQLSAHRLCCHQCGAGGKKWLMPASLITQFCVILCHLMSVLFLKLYFLLLQSSCPFNHVFFFCCQAGKSACRSLSGIPA